MKKVTISIAMRRNAKAIKNGKQSTGKRTAYMLPDPIIGFLWCVVRHDDDNNYRWSVSQFDCGLCVDGNRHFTRKDAIDAFTDKMEILVRNKGIEYVKKCTQAGIDQHGILNTVTWNDKGKQK